MAPVFLAKLQLHQIALMHLLNRHEMMHVELVRRFKKHAMLMLALARRRKRSPGSVVCRQLKLLRMQRLLLEPAGDMPGKGEFCERLVEKRFELRRESNTIQLGGTFGSLFGQRLPLHELALNVIERRQLGVPCLQNAQLAFDAEEFADEVFYIRSDRENQFRSRLDMRSGRIGARRQQLLAQFRMRFAELAQELLIELQ